MNARMTTVGFAVVVASVGCASTGGLDARVAELERELKAARTAPTPARAMTADEAVALGNAEAAAQPPLVAFVGEQPRLCRGALCWVIENGHDNPVILWIDGQQVAVVGPMGPLVPPRTRAYVRLTTPGRREVVYDVFDTINLLDHGDDRPLPTVLCRGRVSAYVGSAADLHWGGHTTTLEASYCGGL